VGREDVSGLSYDFPLVEASPKKRSVVHHRVRRGSLLLLLALLPSLASCTASSPPQQASPIEALRGDLTEFLKDPAMTDVRAVIVAEDERTVFEDYSSGGPEDYHNVYSVTKSIASTLVGIAVDEGLLRVDQTLTELLPAYAASMNAQVGATTLEQLLTMTGGFPDTTTAFDASRFTPTSDWVAEDLRSAVTPPGQQFAYSDVGAHLIAAILVQATGRSLLQYAREKLFDPLDIPTDPAAEPLVDGTAFAVYDAEGFTWGVDPQGIHDAASGLALRPRDMLAVGSLFLQQGRWQDRQVVSDTWVQRATSAHVPVQFGAADGYGYLWWVTEADGAPAYFAAGHGGQLIEVVPDRELVVVVSTATGDQPARDDDSLFTYLTYMVDKIIAPALA
jgi:CubicO group peptidase (beta-lactamase class C family)